MVGKLEAALEGPGGNAAIKQLGAFTGALVLALTLHGQHVAVGFDRDFLVREASDRHRDPVGILAGALDVVGRIGLRAIRLRKRIQHGEQTVEADGRAIEWGKINVTHDVFSF